MALLIDKDSDIYIRKVQGWTKKNRYKTIYGVFVKNYPGIEREYIYKSGAEKRVKELRKKAKKLNNI